MQVRYKRCCGLDVHKKTVVACVITPEGQETRTFGTMTKDVLALGDWLQERGVTHVAMESTGVFWKPIYNLLEAAELTLFVANAQQVKAVPGRKTDVKDAEWIANLLRHGLLRPSFIPGREQRELRELVRYRRNLIQQRAQVVNRIQKVLEGANIKLASVASNVVGVSGRAMLEAMVAGVDDPQALADMARGVLRNRLPELQAALRGLVGPHQRMLLESHLRHLDFLQGEIVRLDEEVGRRMVPFEEALRRVQEIPGVGQRVAQEVVAETGVDMSRFPTAAHLASWARVCPSNNKSAGKRMTGRTGHGNRWLRSALVEAGWAAARSRGTYLAAQYRRLAARRGAKRAVIALSHTILVTIYHLLLTARPYQDLGPGYFDQRDRQAVLRRSVRRIERLGFKVTLEAA
jgi:transposase